MANKMFKTKYSSTVNNDDLPTLGDLKVTFYGVSSGDYPSTFNIYGNDAITVSFSTPTLAQSNGVDNMTSVSKITTGHAGDGIYFKVPVGKSVEVTINSKYNIQSFGQQSTNSTDDLGNIGIDIVNDLRYSPMTALHMYKNNPHLYCDFDNVPDNYIPKFISLNLGGNNVIGTPSVDNALIKNINGSFYLSQSNCSGEFHITDAFKVNDFSIRYSPKLKVVVDSLYKSMIGFSLEYMYKAELDLGKIKDCINLTNFSCLSNPGGNYPLDYKITGDISNFANLTKLTTVTIDSYDFTGDISVFANCPNLITLNIFDYKASITGDITSVVNTCTKLTALTIPPTVTITDEQKTTLTNRGCTVRITS